MAKAQIYQLKVTLRGSKPPIWRRLQVESNNTLAELHRILQRAMGWYNAHLHQFIDGRTYYGEPHPDYGLDMEDESKVRLNQIMSEPKDKFFYEYDFGDSWEHELLLEKVLTADPATSYPVCLKGKGACPPEDCGGVWGYYDLLETIQNPDHPEHQDMLEWLGGDFDPDEFSVEEVNERLASL